MKSERWKNYLPAISMGIFAVVFLSLPFLAVFLVVGSLTALACIYAYVIFRIHKLQDEANWSRDVSQDQAFKDVGEPNFRNVTVYIARRSRFF